MTYDPTIPPATSSPANSALTIQTNFAQFAAIFSKTIAGVIYNHIPLNDINEGKHAAVILEKQLTDPLNFGSQSILYCKDVTNASTTQPQLFCQIQDPASPVPVQLSFDKVNTVGPAQFQSFLPGGYILYFGFSNNITINVTLSPTPTQIVCIQAYPVGTDVDNVPFDTNVSVISTNSFKISSADAPALSTFIYMVIAKQ